MSTVQSASAFKVASHLFVFLFMNIFLIGF